MTPYFPVAFSASWKAPRNGNIRSAKFLMGRSDKTILRLRPVYLRTKIPKSIHRCEQQNSPDIVYCMKIPSFWPFTWIRYVNTSGSDGDGNTRDAWRKEMEMGSKYVKQVQGALADGVAPFTPVPMGRLLLHSGLISLGSTRNRRKSTSRLRRRIQKSTPLHFCT